MWQNSWTARTIAYCTNQSCPRLLLSLEGPEEGSQTISAVGRLVLPIIVHTQSCCHFIANCKHSTTLYTVNVKVFAGNKFRGRGTYTYRCTAVSRWKLSFREQIGNRNLEHLLLRGQGLSMAFSATVHQQLHSNVVVKWTGH